MSTSGSEASAAGYPGLREARAVDPLAPELVNLLAFLAPRAFPVWLLAEQAHRVPGRLAASNAAPPRIRDVIEALVEVEFLRRSDGGVWIPEEVQSGIRADLVRPQAAGYADAVVRILEAVVDEEEPREEEALAERRREVVLPHAPAVAARLAELGRAPDRALVLGARAVEAAAEGSAEAARAAARMVAVARGSRRLREPFLLAALLDQLAELRAARGDAGRAVRHRDEAVRVAEDVCPPDDPRRAVVLHNAGDLSRRLERHDEAAELLERCLELLGAGEGPEDSLRVRAALDLAEVRLAADEPGAAEAARAAVEASRRRLGTAHPETAAGWSLWGRALGNRARHGAAAACFRRALAALEETYGSEHPALGPDLGNLAGSLEDLGDRAGARRLHGRAARIFREAYGEDHRLTVAAEERRREA